MADQEFLDLEMGPENFSLFVVYRGLYILSSYLKVRIRWHRKEKVGVVKGPYKLINEFVGTVPAVFEFLYVGL